MRWSYLLPRLFIVAIVWAFFAFGFDPLLRYSATQTLQSVTGAKVDVRQLDTQFFPPMLTVSDVQLADRSKPGRNLVEFGEIKFHLNGDALLRRSYVVETAEMTGVRLGTPRADDGQLPVEEQSEGSAIPGWVSDQLESFGDEWLDSLTADVKEKLDPNVLESYRLGNQLYVKWDGRFHDVNDQIKTAAAQLKLLKQQMEAARKGDTLDQIQNYLQLAQDADLLLRSTRATVNEFRQKVPAEIRADLAKLNDAQKNDRQMVAHSLRMLKPDPRRITESLIGESMYLQLHQMLSWLETLQDYQHKIKQPPPPERSRGREFEFPLFHPTPKFLVRKMLLTGELPLSDSPTPFHAEVRDITSDPRLLGKPAVLDVATDGKSPVRLVVQHDATSDVAVTQFATDFTDHNGQELSAGKPNGNRLTARLNKMHWNARVTLRDGKIDGTVQMQSDFGDAHLQTESDKPLLASLSGLAETTLSGVRQINGTIRLTGDAKRPDVRFESDLGTQVASGLESAMASFLPEVQGQLLTAFDGYVDQQKQKLYGKLGDQYKHILTDHQQLLASITSTRQLLADLKSGRANPDAVFQAVSQSGVLSDGDQKKADKIRGTANEILRGLNAPDRALQDALPSLQNKWQNKLLDKLRR
ncbi:MAG: TIGR03545 family protein [Planctomycetaceae bacterium]|nr:TIGR03545 family protein [Planctomycetaceae bacterium]